MTQKRNLFKFINSGKDFRSCHYMHGFTLIELIMVIVLLGTLSAVALPKLFDKNTFAERAFFDDTLNAIRYAHTLAVTTGCDVQVSISSNSYTLNRQGTSSSASCPGGTTFALSVPRPGLATPIYSGSESGITLTSSVPSFTFNSLGVASTNVTLTVQGTRTIRVIAKTGFVYVP